MSRKLVDREILNSFKIKLEILESKISSLDEKLEVKECIDFFEKYIIEANNEQLNEIKKDVYMKMKSASSEAESKKLYELYQALKEVNMR